MRSPPTTFFSDLSTYTNIIVTISPQIESVKKIFGVLSVSDDVSNYVGVILGYSILSDSCFIMIYIILQQLHDMDTCVGDILFF